MSDIETCCLIQLLFLINNLEKLNNNRKSPNDNSLKTNKTRSKEK